MTEYLGAGSITYSRPSLTDPLDSDSLRPWQCPLCGALVSIYDHGQALYRHEDWHRELGK